MTELNHTHDVTARSSQTTRSAIFRYKVCRSRCFGAPVRQSFRGSVAIGDQIPDLAVLSTQDVLEGTAAEAATACQNPQLDALFAAEKAAVTSGQRAVLEQRYDLSDRPTPSVMMSGGRKPVQGGVRVKLPPGVTWNQLAAMSPDDIRLRGLLPPGFMPLPHVKQLTGGQVF